MASESLDTTGTPVVERIREMAPEALVWHHTEMTVTFTNMEAVPKLPNASIASDCVVLGGIPLKVVVHPYGTDGVSGHITLSVDVCLKRIHPLIPTYFEVELQVPGAFEGDGWVEKTRFKVKPAYPDRDADASKRVAVADPPFESFAFSIKRDLIVTATVCNVSYETPEAEGSRQCPVYPRHLMRMMESGRMCDVAFEVSHGVKGEGTRFNAHSLIVRSASAVFDKMISCASHTNVAVVHIDSVDPETFRGLLSFMYTGAYSPVVNMSGGVSSSRNNNARVYRLLLLLYAAHEFGVDDLVENCETELLSVIQKFNAHKFLVDVNRQPHATQLVIRHVNRLVLDNLHYPAYKPVLQSLEPDVIMALMTTN